MIKIGFFFSPILFQPSLWHSIHILILFKCIATMCTYIIKRMCSKVQQNSCYIMKQKKRWRVIILVLVFCFLFSACQYIILNLSVNKTKTVPLPHSSLRIKSKYVWNYFLILGPPRAPRGPSRFRSDEWNEKMSLYSPNFFKRTFGATSF